MWTTENTEGFSGEELAIINAAVSSIWADADDADESYLAHLNDLATNCWQDGMDAEELYHAVIARL